MAKFKTFIFYFLLILFLASFFSVFLKFLNFAKPVNIILNANLKESDDAIVETDKNYYLLPEFKNIYNLTLKEKLTKLNILINKDIIKKAEHIVVFNDITLYYFDSSSFSSKEEKICLNGKCKNYLKYDLSEKIKKKTISPYLNASSTIGVFFEALNSFFECNYLFYPTLTILFILIYCFTIFKNKIKIFRIPNYITAFLILILTVILRTISLGYESPWGDEYYAIDTANPKNPFRRLFEDPGNPPFYFFVLRFFITLFGEHLISMRLLSVIFSVLGVLFLWIFLKRNFSIKSANIASFILAINIFSIYFSKEIRCYSLLSMLSILSSLFLFEIIKNNKLKYYILYGFIIIALVNTHYYGVLYTISNFFFGIFIFIKEKRKKDICKFLLINLLSLISFLPFFIHTSYQKALLDETFNVHFEKLSLNLIKTIIYYIFGGFISLSLSLVFFIKLNFLKSRKKAKILINYCFFMIFFILFLSIILSYLIRPMIVNRYFLLLVPLFAIFISMVFEVSKNKYSAVIFLIWIFFIQTYDSKTLVNIRKRCMTSNNTFKFAFNYAKDKKVQNLYFILRPSDGFFVEIIKRDNFKNPVFYKFKNSNYSVVKELKNGFDIEEIVQDRIEKIKNENKNAIIFTPLLKSNEINANKTDRTCYFNTASDSCIWKIE